LKVSKYSNGLFKKFACAAVEGLYHPSQTPPCDHSPWKIQGALLALVFIGAVLNADSCSSRWLKTSDQTFQALYSLQTTLYTCCYRLDCNSTARNMVLGVKYGLLPSVKIMFLLSFWLSCRRSLRKRKLV